MKGVRRVRRTHRRKLMIDCMSSRDASSKEVANYPPAAATLSCADGKARAHQRNAQDCFPSSNARSAQTPAWSEGHNDASSGLGWSKQTPLAMMRMAGETQM